MATAMTDPKMWHEGSHR